MLSDVRGAASTLARTWRGWSWKTRERVGGGLAVLVLVAALVSTWEPVARLGGPEDAVRDYLETVRAGDVEKALALARQRPQGESARFLNAGSLDGDWTITAVDTIASDERSARVAVTLAAYGYERAGSFSAHKGATGTWSVVDPFVRASVAVTPARYMDLNGEVSTWEAPDPAREYLLFPGAYRVHPGGDALTSSPLEFLALNGTDPVSLSIPSPAATGAGRDSARAAVAAFIADCAKSTELAPPNCPFAAGYDIGDHLGHEDLRDHREIRWTVTETPVVEFAVNGSFVQARESRAGAVELSFTATEHRWNGDDWVPGDEEHLTTTCRIDVGSLALTLHVGGTWRVAHVADPGAVFDPLSYRPAASVDTCGVAKG